MGYMLVLPGHARLDINTVHEQVHRAVTPLARESWQTIWLAAPGWSAARTSATFGQVAQTIGSWAEEIRELRPAGLCLAQAGLAAQTSSQKSKPR